MTDCNLEFARGGAEFTVDLYEKLKAGTSGRNLIVSPFSIQTCMALVFAGAKGETANEISRALKYKSNSCTDVAKTFQFVLDQYKDSELLKIANKLYVQEGCTIKAEYGAITKEQFHATAEAINFAATDIAAKNINNWVSEKTVGKISKIIDPSVLGADTRLVLLNAIHFKGDWQSKFDASQTKEGDFWLNENDSIKAQYMNQEAHFNFDYFHDYKCKGLEMFYKDSDLSMFILLPDERNGLPELAAKLKNIDLFELRNCMDSTKVRVKFPKFKVNFEIELNKMLIEMGVHLAFGLGDFSNMLESSEPLSVSKVLHKACIEVNEEGSEAAAVTAAVMQFRCMPRIFEFEADHPFFYWIWNGQNILFAGTFVNAPNED